MVTKSEYRQGHAVMGGAKQRAERDRAQQPDTRRGNLRTVPGAKVISPRFHVHARGVRLGSTHVIPACRVDRDMGWGLYARNAAAADEHRNIHDGLLTADYVGTADAVTCRKCKAKATK